MSKKVKYKEMLKNQSLEDFCEEENDEEKD